MTETDLWPLEETDASRLFTLVDRNRSRLHKFWWERGTRSAIDSRHFIVQAQNDEVGFDQPRSLSRGIFAASELIGVGAIHSIDWDLGRAALGYWIDEDHDGKGHATKTVRALSRIAFEELMLEELTISPRAANIGSRRVAEKNGFKLERVDFEPAWQLDSEDETPEVAHYLLTRDDFEQSVA